MKLETTVGSSGNRKHFRPENMDDVITLLEMMSKGEDFDESYRVKKQSKIEALQEVIRCVLKQEQLTVLLMQSLINTLEDIIGGDLDERIREEGSSGDNGSGGDTTVDNISNETAD